jgi:Predicted amidohydrolase
MKIALYQKNIIWEDKEANYLHLEERLQMPSGKDIDMILLPEMSFTGFSMNTDATKEADFKTIKKVGTIAKQYHIAIGFGWVKDCGAKSENHYTVINQYGDILSDYAKIHPFSYSGEDKKFQGGSNIPVFQFEGTTFSTFICYDLRFPEVFQIASKSADAILVPANWPEVRAEHWKCLLRARAVENQVYIMAVNCVGNMNGLDYSGDSCIIAPDGEILQELSGREGVLEYEWKDDVQRIRKEFPVKKDRREDLYHILCQTGI